MKEDSDLTFLLLPFIQFELTYNPGGLGALDDLAKIKLGIQQLQLS